MCFPYIPHEGSTVYNDRTNGIELFEDYLLQIVLKFPDALLLLAGDFNARCGSRQDILFDDDVSFIFDEDVFYEADSFQMSRKSKDIVENSFGRALIDLCKNFSIHIFNGRNQKDKLGEFTCIANDGRSIVDYFIASSYLFPHIAEFEIGKRSESVHFPLHCKLKFESKDTYVESKQHNAGSSYNNNQHLSNEVFEKYKWDENKKKVLG